MNSYILVSANYPPHVGGVERYSEKVAYELSRRGNRVYVLTSGNQENETYEQVNDGIEIIRVPSLELLGGRMPVLRMTKAWRRVRKKLSEIENPRVIIQTFLYPLSYAAARLARQKKWAFIVINHGCNYVCQGKGLVDRAEHIYEEILARLVVRKAGGCYAVSKASGEWAEHFGIRFLGVLSNAIDAEGTLSRLNVLASGVREAYGISKESVIISYVGRMIPEKGIRQLVQAVRKLKEEENDVFLIAAGDGPLLSEMQKSENKGVVFLGNTAHDDVLRLLRESDCCCLPSDSEGFPTVLLEAALCKNYLIGSPYGGTPELIGDRACGTVMPGNSFENIYEALRNMMDRREQCALIGENAYRRVLNQFTWKNTCDAIETIAWDAKDC